VKVSHARVKMSRSQVGRYVKKKHSYVTFDMLR
jgi:hypothetical protein